MTRILGVDPGSRVTGFGLIESNGTRISYVDCGCIRTGSGSVPERLRAIYLGVQELLDDYRPAVVAVESVFVSRNVSSTLKLGQARGVAICAAAVRQIPLAEYAPAQIKQAVVGKGNADKSQVQYMVKILLGLNRSPANDAADALAGAICHARHHPDGWPTGLGDRR